MIKENKLILYQRESCPYCQIVRKKLNLLGLTFLMVPVEKNGEDRQELISISGQQAVPVLVDQGKVLVESSVILDYLDKTYGSGQPEVMSANDYGLKTKVKGSFDDVMAKTVDALKTEGFGVLTDINVKNTLKKKIDVDVPQQTILGACNPKFAHQALQAEEDLGLLLPCNVVVREAEAGFYWVTAVNPLKLLSVVGRDDLLPVAAEIKNKMRNVIHAVSQ
jgi:uncharacterized protein (DUF302 family)/glutaredoxin